MYNVEKCPEALASCPEWFTWGSERPCRDEVARARTAPRAPSYFEHQARTQRRVSARRVVIK